MEVECKIFITSQSYVYKTMLSKNNLSFLTTDFLADIESVEVTHTWHVLVVRRTEILGSCGFSTHISNVLHTSLASCAG